MSEGGSASRPTQPDRLAILCTWSSKEGGRRSGPARLLLPGKPKKWQLATSEQVVLGLRAEHLDKKQQVAVLKKSSRAGKLQRAAAPRVGRRLNSSALFCSVVSQCSRNYRRSTTVVEWRERTYENYRTPTARDNPSIRGEEGRLVSGTLTPCRRCLVMAEMGGTLNSCSCLWRR